MADAIESWGRANRDQLSREELEELGAVWRTIKTSPHATLDFSSMSKDDARAIMGLFEADRRKAVSARLNEVRRWALAQPTEPAQVQPVQPQRRDLPGTETVVMRAPEPDRPHQPSESVPHTSPPPAAVPPVSAVRSGPGPAIGPTGTVTPVGPVSGSVTAVGAPTTGPDPVDVGGQGPVPGWAPPTAQAEPAGQPPWKLIGIVAGVLAAALLIWFLFLRGDDDGTETVQTTENQSVTDSATDADTATASFDAAGSDDFCAVARQLDAADPFESGGLASLGPDFFDQSIGLIDQIQAVAPSEISGDFSTIGQQLRQMQAIVEQYNYDFTDPALGEALAAMDTTAADAAGDRIDAYLSQVCGITTDDATTTAPATGDTGTTGIGVPLSDEQVALVNEAFLAQFNVTPELAECLTTELGDLSAAATDPSILNEPVCGTTLFEIVTGQSG